MTGVALFEKVSLKEYAAAWAQLGREVAGESDGEYSREIREEYDAICLPERATCGSAGYDFFLPRMMHFSPETMKCFPTGIRCKMLEDWFLALLPKSGLGARYGFRLLNTMGVVDADYYYSGNEGQILACVTVMKDLELDRGDKFMQGVFMHFGVTLNDMTTASRNGGFGSTGA